ncbi:hypothetical protein OSB04_012905 [Centaurea solstitialis]|uniref:F-box protein FBW2 n=1 Tax=Centaurea solstitialis TaxID=347529 RepID=A0AA38WQY3_9ASTR|nr:hypothetical protein OSB04_012905 [Centaurea solstitialis]
MEEGRRWEALNPDILALIFVKIKPLDEMVRCVPFVCKPWMEVLAGPYCWRDVNLLPWYESVQADMVVGKLVRRSSCTLQRLCVNQLGESGFLSVVNCYCFEITSKGLVAFGNNCKSLVHLRRNMHEGGAIDDSEAMTIAHTMPSLQRIELRFGLFSNLGLSEILTNCKSLTHLNIYGCWKFELDGDLMMICEKLVHFESPGIDYGSDDDVYVDVPTPTSD